LDNRLRLGVVFVSLATTAFLCLAIYSGALNLVDRTAHVAGNGWWLPGGAGASHGREVNPDGSPVEGALPTPIRPWPSDEAAYSRVAETATADAVRRTPSTQ
jgi:hypothetical protein